MEHRDKLRDILRVRGWTQETLAHRLGISFVSLNAWINGRARPRRPGLEAIDGAYAELAVGTSRSTSQLLSEMAELTELAGPSQRTSIFDEPPRLTETQLCQLLDGSSDSETIALVREAQYVEFLRNLASIVASVPLVSATAAITLLDRAKQRDRHTYKRSMMYPHIAAWAAACVRALRGVSNDRSPDDHIQHLSAIAAVVAWKCGVPSFSIRMPLRNGEVVLPSLGRALLPGDEDASEATLVCGDHAMTITTSTQTVSLPADLTCGTLEWEPIRTVSVDSDGLVLHLLIDDIDPYRLEDETLPSSISSRRLDQVDYKAWKERLHDAWELLVQRHSAHAHEIAQSTSVLVPIEDDIVHSTSFHRGGFGAIISTLGASPAWTAAGMLEEFQRMKLNALHSIEPLHTAPADVANYLAPFFNEPRTLHNVVETFYSSAPLAEFWNAHYRASFESEKFNAAINCRFRHQWKDWLFYVLMESQHLTEFGERLISTTHARFAESSEHLPQSVLEITRDVTADRRMCNRLTSLRCDDGDIRRLGVAWMAGMSCPTERQPRVFLSQPERSVFGWKRRQQLAELRVLHPEQFEELLGSNHYLELVVPTATKADALATAGQFVQAVEAYRRAIEVDPSDNEAWGGLAAVGARAGIGVVSTLGRFPEVVMALHRRIRSTYDRVEDPVVLAKWLEPLLLCMDDQAFQKSTSGSSVDG